jgi:hypothetical protein
MSRWDFRQDLRPLLSGNLSVLTYVPAMLTRLFNEIQAIRAGVQFPAMPSSSTAGSSGLLPEHRLPVGAVVRIRTREEIAGTLKNSRNRGLWFDADMVRYCGQCRVVRGYVDRLIHEVSGLMIQMRTACVTLEDVVATGEFHRLSAQHEYIYWREAWLQPLAGEPASEGSRELATSNE